MLVVGNHLNEKGLVEGFIGLILADEQSALFGAVKIEPLADSFWVLLAELVIFLQRRCCLLKDNHGLQLFVEGPKDFLERVDNLVVEQLQKLDEDLDSALVLRELVQVRRLGADARLF